MQYVPISIRRTVKCDRCELWYPRKEDACSHCSDLSDQEVAELKEAHEHQHHGNARVGLFMLVLAVIIFLAVLAAVLSTR